MVKHIILWQLKDELSDTEKAAVKAEDQSRTGGACRASPRGLSPSQCRQRGCPALLPT